VCASITSGLVGVSSQSFMHTTCREPGVIKWVQFLEGLPPKIWKGKKPSKIWHDFWQLSNMLSRICPKLINKSKIGKVVDQLLPLPRWKKTVNFGPQTKKLLKCILTNPSGQFSGDYTSALRGCYALKFLHALPRLPGAHPNWDGGPPEKF